jgi:hypothetical protein
VVCAATGLIPSGSRLPATAAPTSRHRANRPSCWRGTHARRNASCVARMAGPGNNPVQVLSTGLPLHWVKFTFETGFELPSSCITLSDYASNLNRNILDFMRWSQIDLGAQDLNDIQRPKSFQKNSWK